MLYSLLSAYLIDTRLGCISGKIGLIGVFAYCDCDEVVCVAFSLKPILDTKFTLGTI
jgi:hypothetical protein